MLPSVWQYAYASSCEHAWPWRLTFGMLLGETLLLTSMDTWPVSQNAPPAFRQSLPGFKIFVRKLSKEDFVSPCHHLRCRLTPSFSLSVCATGNKSTTYASWQIGDHARLVDGQCDVIRDGLFLRNRPLNIHLFAQYPFVLARVPSLIHAGEGVSRFVLLQLRRIPALDR